MNIIEPDQAFSRILIALLKGMLYADSDASLWQSLLKLQARVRDHVTVIGLDLVLDEAEGYAFLRQRPALEGEPELPRLVSRRQLGYPVSLLLALLRKKLAEFDARSEDSKLVLSRTEIVELVKVFFPDSGNEARLMDKLDAHISKVAELGFLRRLKGDEARFEVRRILKAFVDAQWLQEFASRLEAYRTRAAEAFSESEPGTSAENPQRQAGES